MNQRLAQIAIVVNDYDEAIKFYTEKLNFILIEDTVLSETKRWVVIKPTGEGGCNILLAKAANEEQRSRIGNQTGGRVFLFMHTDDLKRDHENMLANNIEFVRQPSEEVYGTVAVFKDLYGNLWDLIQPKEKMSELNKRLFFSVRSIQSPSSFDDRPLESSTPFKDSEPESP